MNQTQRVAMTRLAASKAARHTKGRATATFDLHAPSAADIAKPPRCAVATLEQLQSKRWVSRRTDGDRVSYRITKAGSGALASDLGDYGDVSHFARDRLVFVEGGKASAQSIAAAYSVWAGSLKLSGKPSIVAIVKKLRAIASITTRRERQGRSSVTFYHGVQLR